MTAFITLLRRPNTVAILDGAGGTELEARGFRDPDGTWSAAAIRDAPDLVLAIHRDYIAAGAEIITTQTFTTRPRRLRKAGIEDQVEAIARRGVALAKQAVTESGRSGVLIAASMATQEIYSDTDAAPGGDEAFAEHLVMARIYAEAGVDLLLFEAFSTIREAYAAVRAGVSTGIDTVVGFVCGSGGRLLSGEPIAEAVRAIDPLGPAAYAVNCTPVPLATRAAADLARATATPFGVYANVGDWRPAPKVAGHIGAVAAGHDAPGYFARTFGERNIFEVTPEAYAQHAAGWRELGAAFVGGCCGTRPAHIAALSATLG